MHLVKTLAKKIRGNWFDNAKNFDVARSIDTSSVNGMIVKSNKKTLLIFKGWAGIDYDLFDNENVNDTKSKQF